MYTLCLIAAMVRSSRVTQEVVEHVPKLVEGINLL